MTAWDQQLSDESPGYVSSKLKLRRSESLAVGRLLLGAAAVCVLRVTVMPWIIKLAPPGSYGRVDEMDVVAQGLVMMVCFALCSMLARIRPVAATVVALGCLTIVTYNDLNRFGDVIEAGIINKSVIGLLLLRASMTAFVGRLM
jgi:hypothetical protein